MILNFETLRSDNPLAIQVIEKTTDFVYDPAYGQLMKDKRAMGFQNIENFFDNWGWRIAIIPGEYPTWGFAIVDRNDSTVHQNLSSPELFTRDHAKSMAAGVAIHLFEQQLRDTFKIEGNETVLEPKDLLPGAESKTLGTLTPADFSLDAQGIISTSEFVLYKVNNDYVVIKNALGKLPFVGMILSF